MNASSRMVSAGVREPAMALFRLMAEQWPGFVLVLDRELRVRWVNAACMSLFKDKPLDAPCVYWSDLGLPWQLREDFPRTLGAMGEVKLEAAPFAPADGNSRLYTARLVPLRETPNLITAILCVIEETDSLNVELLPIPVHQPHDSAAAAQVGYWHWDFGKRSFAVDEHWCRAMNVETSAGQDHLSQWIERIHPDDAIEYRRKRADVEFGRADRFEAEYRLMTNDMRWLWVLQRGRVVEKDKDGAHRVSGFCIEIDERKRAEVALQENEARLATALWGARAAFWQWQIVTDTMTLSPLWFAITGYTREQWESISKPWTSRIHPDDRDRVSQRIRVHLEGQSQSIEVEFRVRTASDDWKWMLMRGRVVEWDFDGRPTSAIGVSLDIDAQKHAELELRSSEARLETAVWGAGMGLWEIDFREEWTRWFSDWCERFDLYPCDGKDHIARWDANIHPDDITEASRRFGDHVAGKEDYYDAEYRIRDRKGRWRWLFERGRVVERASDGTAIRMVGICVDVDARKEAELALMKSQRRLEIALESARGGMWDWDIATDVSVNTEYIYRMLGVEPEIGRLELDFWSDRVHPDDLPRVLEALRAVVDGETKLFEAEYRLRHADGSWRWVLDRGRAAEHDENGKVTRVVGFIVEITDRIQTQEALRRSEFRYRTVASMTPGYIFEYRFNARGDIQPVWISDGVQAVYGCSVQEFLDRGGLDAFCEPEYQPAAREQRLRVRQGDVPSGEIRVRTVGGETKCLHTSSTPLRDPSTGAVVGFIGAAYDITTRKLAERAQRESEAVLRAVTENTPDWLFLIDCERRVRFMNRTFGNHQAEDVLNRSLLDFIPEAYRAELDALYQRVFTTGLPGRFDVRNTNSDGSLTHYEHRVVAVVQSGSVSALTVAVTDVTERRRAEIQLRESQSTLRAVAGSSADWLAMFDPYGKCTFVNRSMRDLPPEAWINRSIEEFAPSLNPELGRATLDHVLTTGEPRDVEHVMPLPQHGERHLQVRLRAVKSDGRVLGVLANITDVTERHAQENALRTQARILETMREGVVLVDAYNRIQLTNETFSSMFGYPASELLGRDIEPLLSIPPAKRKRIERSLRGDDSKARRDSMPVEFECLRRDGTRFVASCLFTPLNIGGKNHWLAVLNDVTERKRLEREIIEIANREQQRIGSDLHDGLGQDLTGIALMLRGVEAQLHKEGSAARMDVEDVISLVNSAIDSTRALARGLSPVSAERGGLNAALRALAVRAGDRYGVYVAFYDEVMEPLRLDETAATHLYRIAQEALTNVIRHSLATEVRIQLETTDDELVLKIEDNGRGFMQHPPEGANGLGLKIMRYRAQMLGGDLVLEAGPNGGASVRCSCPLALAALGERTPRSAFAAHEP